MDDSSSRTVAYLKTSRHPDGHHHEAADMVVFARGVDHVLVPPKLVLLAVVVAAPHLRCGGGRKARRNRAFPHATHIGHCQHGGSRATALLRPGSFQEVSIDAVARARHREVLATIRAGAAAATAPSTAPLHAQKNDNDDGKRQAPPPAAQPQHDDPGNKKQCKEMQDKHTVKPGISWGTLPQDLRGVWQRLKCDDVLYDPTVINAKLRQWKVDTGFPRENSPSVRGSEGRPTLALIRSSDTTATGQGCADDPTSLAVLVSKEMPASLLAEGLRLFGSCQVRGGEEETERV